MRFEILLEPYAIIDIQEAIAFYDTEHQGLGRKFENSLNRLFVGLEKYPFYARSALPADEEIPLYDTFYGE